MYLDSDRACTRELRKDSWVCMRGAALLLFSGLLFLFGTFDDYRSIAAAAAIAAALYFSGSAILCMISSCTPPPKDPT